jgi:hypothetical protein
MQHDERRTARRPPSSGSADQPAGALLAAMAPVASLAARPVVSLAARPVSLAVSALLFFGTFAAAPAFLRALQVAAPPEHAGPAPCAERSRPHIGHAIPSDRAACVGALDRRPSHA